MLELQLSKGAFTLELSLGFKIETYASSHTVFYVWHSIRAQDLNLLGDIHDLDATTTLGIFLI